MITFRTGDRTVVLILCFDKYAQKYRLANIGERTIAPQTYSRPADALEVLRRLEEEGKITELKNIEEI